MIGGNSLGGVTLQCVFSEVNVRFEGLKFFGARCVATRRGAVFVKRAQTNGNNDSKLTR
jgi:hypothetical protein